MIMLDNVSRIQRTDTGTLLLLSDVTYYFGRNERVGILAAPGSGKSSIARLLSGVEKPDSGFVYREGKTSWPIGFAGGFHPELTGAQNITFLSELVGQDPLEAIAFCTEFADLGDSMSKKIKAYSSLERAMVSYSFSLSVPCDMYIADEVIGVGDPEMRLRCGAILDQRLENAGLIFLSKNPAQLEKHCTRFLLLIESQLAPCDNLKLGVEALMQSSERSQVPPHIQFQNEKNHE